MPVAALGDHENGVICLKASKQRKDFPFATRHILSQSQTYHESWRFGRFSLLIETAVSVVSGEPIA